MLVIYIENLSRIFPTLFSELISIHNPSPYILLGESCKSFRSHRECMEEDYEYANEFEKQGRKIRERY